ncbi:g5354 [Coccomyxa elongata]
MEFKGLDGRAADPLLVTIVANIIFDVRPMPEALVCPLAAEATIKKIPLAHFPRDLFQVGRSIMILRSLTHALGMHVGAAHLWRG